jgi:hypothetical protein
VSRMKCLTCNVDVPADEGQAHAHTNEEVSKIVRFQPRDRVTELQKACNDELARRRQAVHDLEDERKLLEAVLVVRNRWEIELLDVYGVLGVYPDNGYEGLAGKVKARIDALEAEVARLKAAKGPWDLIAKDGD